MKTSHTTFSKYPETERINEIWDLLVSLSQSLVHTVDFFSTNAIATVAERTAALSIAQNIESLHGIGEAKQTDCFDSVDDVSDVLLDAHAANLATIRQHENVQSMRTLLNELEGLRTARDAHKGYRRGTNSSYELKRKVTPTLTQLFADFEYCLRLGTAEQKTAVDEIIDWINNSLINTEYSRNLRATYNAKKNGGEQSNKPGHKPHDPNKPSDNEDRPEGVPPNEDSDEPGGENPPSGGDDNTGDSGNTGNGGGENSGGSGNNNQPGGDKPPNPEEPDKRDGEDNGGKNKRRRKK
jgi:hypothetical protein